MKHLVGLSVLFALVTRVTGAGAAPSEWFVLWQGRGDWQCTVTLSAGTITSAEPYMFLDARDGIAVKQSQRVVCTTHSRGNAAGLHVFAEGATGAIVRIETNRGSEQVPVQDLSPTEPRVIALPVDAGGGFLIFGRGDPARGPREVYRAKLPPLFEPPVPHNAVRLPSDASGRNPSLQVALASTPPPDLRVRRVGKQDGLLYLELFSPSAPLSGRAEVVFGSAPLASPTLDGSLWLALEPRIGRIAVEVTSPAGTQTLHVPTTLVEVRGPQLFVNGEPFLIKGTLPGELPAEDAEFIRSLGMNTLRGGTAPGLGERYGFMAIASLQGGALRKLADYRGPGADAELARDLAAHFVAKSENARAAADNPYTLVLQLDNERTESGANPLDPEANNTGCDPWSDFVRGEQGDFVRLDRILARAWNLIKPMAPMLPLGYANETQGYMAPEFLDVYLHNSYLPRDRYSIPFREFSRLQGGAQRPFINTEWGANRFTPESYHGAKNSPLLEKLQAWGYRQTWEAFMDAGTAGGTSYKLYDSAKDTDQGTRNFGIMTGDRQPKLACWDLWHLWRDFDVAPAREDSVRITLRRDYAVRDCRLTLSRPGRVDWTVDLGEFRPHSQRTVALTFSAPEFRWRIEGATHRGLQTVATGAWPAALEETDFAQKLAKRDAPEFLRALLTARVLTTDGRDAPAALVDMTVADGIIPVAFRCADGSTYVTAFTRRRLRGSHYVKADLRTAFRGEVVRVDEWTGRPIAGNVPHESTTDGIVFKSVDIPSIPGPIGQRANEPISLPVFRIRPAVR